MPGELTPSEIERVLSGPLLAHRADLEDFREHRWFERAVFRRAFGKKPSWCNPVGRWFFDRAMAEARRIGTTTSERECLVVPVWSCAAHEEAESGHRLHLLSYFGPGDFDLKESTKAVVIHARVIRCVAPYLAARRGYASTVELPRFGPYAVVSSCCGVEIVDVFKAVAVEPAPPPLDPVPAFGARLTLAIPLGEVPEVFREPLAALIGGRGGSGDLGERSVAP